VFQSLSDGETATTALLKNLAILSLFFLYRMYNRFKDFAVAIYPGGRFFPAFQCVQ
jgi:hypothetical protein